MDDKDTGVASATVQLYRPVIMEGRRNNIISAVHSLTKPASFISLALFLVATTLP